MAILLSELQSALNDVVIACLETADGHETAADILGDDRLATELRALAEERRQAAAELGELVRGLGDLPPAPDTDLEAVRELASRVMAALSSDQQQTVLAERRAAEAAVGEVARTALERADLPAPSRALLILLTEQTGRAEVRLAHQANDGA